MTRTRQEIVRRASALWARTSHRLSAALDAIPVGIVTLGVGIIALTASNRLPVWLALPTRDLQVALAGAGVSAGASATLGAGVSAALTFLALLAASGLLLAAGQSTPPGWLRRAARWLAIPVLLWSLVASLQTAVILGRGLAASATQSPPAYTADEMYYNQYSARLLLAGVNPYTDADAHLSAAMTFFHIRGFTPIARGRFSDPRHTPTGHEMRAVAAEYQAHPFSPPPELDPDTLHSYPAGAFLVDVPSVWLGLPGMGVAQILLFMALSVALVTYAPPGVRLAVGLLVWANPVFAQRVVTGDFDIWWMAALIGAWLLGDRRWLSGALVGVACAIKQTAWFAAPFYFLWVWRRDGLAEALRRVGIACAAFLLINLPWLIVSPRAWLSSVLLPLSLPLLPNGSGLIALAQAGLLPLIPALYTLLELGVWAGALACVWRLLLRGRLPAAGLVAGLLPLLVAWRSPERYFLALSTLALAGLLLSWRAPFPARAGEGFRLPSPRGKGAEGEIPAPLSSQEQG
jgi:hypothetical protein